MKAEIGDQSTTFPISDFPGLPGKKKVPSIPAMA
jgi:hypothetical protein